MSRLAVAMLLATVLNAQDSEPVRIAKEEALSRAVAADVRQRTTAVENPLILGYVERAATRLAPQFAEVGLEFTFALVADNLPEPIAVLDGLVFVPVPLLADAPGESEFTGLLAHAMAHVTEMRQAYRQTGGQNAGRGRIPLFVAGGELARCKVPSPPQSDSLPSSDDFRQERDEARRLTAKPPRPVPSLLHER